MSDTDLRHSAYPPALAQAPASAVGSAGKRGPLAGVLFFLRRVPLSARVAFFVLAAYGVVAAFAPLLAPFSPVEIFVGAPFDPPSLTHFLGTDAMGRDVFSRVLYGGRTAFSNAAAAAAITVVVGGFLGLMLGLVGGLIDEIGMRALEVIACIPSVILALLMLGSLGSAPVTVIVTVGLLAVTSTTRVVRGAALAFVAEDFILAARARGESTLSIALRELLPNISGTLLVEFSIRTAWAIILIGALAFLGFGTPPPTPDWGTMINEGRGALDASIWPVVAPGAGIVLLVLAVNVLTDGIARALGPTR